MIHYTNSTVEGLKIRNKMIKGISLRIIFMVTEKYIISTKRSLKYSILQKHDNEAEARKT